MEKEKRIAKQILENSTFGKYPAHDESARFSVHVQMGGDSKAKRGISFSMNSRELVIKTYTWDTKRNDSQENESITVTNVKALQRLHGLLGTAIKTFEK